MLFSGFYVYKIQNGRGFYTGYTERPTERLEEHNSSAVTKNNRATWQRYQWRYAAMIGPIETEKRAAHLEKKAKLGVASPASYQTHLACMAALGSLGSLALATR